jgi:3-oxoacyl-[acyl-carrier protein] reductase
MKYLIIGGTGGVGQTICGELADRGHDLFFTYNRSQKAAEKQLSTFQSTFPKQRFGCAQLNVASSNAVEELVDRALDEFENIDVMLFNCGMNINSLAVGLDDEDWSRVIQTNLTGAFYCSRAMLTHFLAERFGRFIFISSVAACGSTGQIAYSSSKAALKGLSGTLAKEYGSKGITSNVLELGVFDMGISSEDLSERNESFWKTYNPIRRYGEGKELVHSIEFAASKENSYFNGSVVTLDGGLNWSP